MVDSDPQWELGPIRALEANREGDDLRLTWQYVPGATRYRVMRASRLARSFSHSSKIW